MQENSKEFIMYESFDELPDELKKKFKSEASGSGLTRGRRGYVEFINQLNQRGDELIGDYVDARTRTQVEFGKCSHVADINPNNYKSGQGCGVCRGLQVHYGVNDVATTHPQYTKHFVNVEDAYIHTCGSNRKVALKCYICGHVKSITVNNLIYQGFSCDLCSDGLSYPEKLVASVLTKLNIDFIKQLSYDNGGHKYDFYLPIYKTILETHGMQHYQQSGRGRSLEEEQKNDSCKRQLAIKNGVLNENYHEIDCRYSTLDYCRPNIEQALSNYIDIATLTDEDWKQADAQAQKSLKIEVCKYWKEVKDANSKLTPQRVADDFGVTHVAVRNYLKWGNANGLCAYDGKEEKKASNRRNSTFVYIIKQNGELWFDEPMSMKEMERQTGITMPAIKRNLDKRALKPHKNSKYDPKYIGSRIVSAEVYDSQTQAS